MKAQNTTPSKEKILQQQQQLCPECGHAIVSNGFEVICESCGLVVGKTLVDSSYVLIEKKDTVKGQQYVSMGDDRVFVGSLGTFIDFKGNKILRDVKGNAISPNDQKLYKRIKKGSETYWRLKGHEREYRIYQKLSKVCSYLGVNGVAKKNAWVYYKTIVSKADKVINYTSLIGFCLNYAINQNSSIELLSIREVCKAFQAFRYRVTPRLILRDGVLYKDHLKCEFKEEKTERFLNRYIKNLLESGRLEKRLEKKRSPYTVLEYLKKLRETTFALFAQYQTNASGVYPEGLAGALLYCADVINAKKEGVKKVLTQKMLSSILRVPEYTIRDIFINHLKKFTAQGYSAYKEKEMIKTKTNEQLKVFGTECLRCKKDTSKRILLKKVGLKEITRELPKSLREEGYREFVCQNVVNFKHSWYNKTHKWFKERCETHLIIKENGLRM